MSVAAETQILDLSGRWHYALDPEDQGSPKSGSLPIYPAVLSC